MLFSCYLGGSIVMGIPQSLGELEWNILYNGWFRGTPILGHLHFSSMFEYFWDDDDSQIVQPEWLWDIFVIFQRGSAKNTRWEVGRAQDSGWCPKGWQHGGWHWDSLEPHGQRGQAACCLALWMLDALGPHAGGRDGCDLSPTEM